MSAIGQGRGKGEEEEDDSAYTAVDAARIALYVFGLLTDLPVEDTGAEGAEEAYWRKPVSEKLTSTGSSGEASPFHD